MLNNLDNSKNLLFNSNNIKNFLFENNTISGKVTIENEQEYLVKILLDEYDKPIANFCQCKNTTKLCSHALALLSHYQLQNNKNPIVNIDNFEDDIKIELNNKTNSPKKSLANIERFFHDHSTKHKEEIAFIIERTGYNFLKDNWVLYPILASNTASNDFYFKRINNQSIDVCIENYSIQQDAIPLLNALLTRENNTDLLQNYLHLFTSGSIDILFLKQNRNYTKLKLTRFNNLSIKFTLLDINKGNPIFSPKILLTNDVLTNDKNISSIKINSLSNFVYDGNNLFIIPQTGALSGTLFYKENSTFVYELSKLLFEKKHFYNYDDINTIKSFVSQKSDDISIEFSIDTVRIISPVPKSFIEITETKKNDLKINLLFDYRGNEVDYTVNSQYVFIEETANEYIMAKRQNDYERRIFTFLSKLFSNLMITLNSSLFSNKQDKENFKEFQIVKNQGAKYFTCNSDLDQFIFSCGEVLIENNIEIRIKGNDKKITKNNLSIGFSGKSDFNWLEFGIHCTDENGIKHPVNLKRSFVRGRMIKTKNFFTIISYEDLEKIKSLLSVGELTDNSININSKNTGIINILYDKIENKNDLNIKKSKEIHDKLKDFTTINNYEVPFGFKGILRDYQQSGYNWLNFLHEYNLNGCLADDMGLGKTIQTLAFLFNQKHLNPNSTSLIVVPVVTITNWENEIKKFTPNIKYLIHHGQSRKKDIDYIKIFDVVIVSYNTLRNDIEHFTKIYFNYVVLDEAQNIKNYKSVIFKSIKLLNSAHRLSLTGTPIENTILELWSQMEFLNPGLLGKISDFKKNFAKPIEIDQDENTTARLKEIIYPFILRRKKESVVHELPPKTEIVLYSEMNDEQAALYNNLRDHYKEKIDKKIEKDGINSSAIDIFEAMLKLRQLALFPQLIDSSYREVSSTKFEQIKGVINTIINGDHKLIIFSQFVRTLTIIKEFCNENKLSYSYIDGSVNSKKRASEIDKFQNDNKTKLILLSLKAGGVGINLTSADYVVLFDPWWNPALESQAIDRAYRIGQNRKVFAYKLIVKNTIEEKILQLQERKKDLARGIITNEKSFFKYLSKQDIINFFE